MSAPTNHVPPAAFASNPSYPQNETVAVLTSNQLETTICERISHIAGIFGSDSGPPDSGPHCVWLGRAPPRFLA